MLRRQLFERTFVLIAGGYTALSGARAFGQSTEIVDEILFARPWVDQADYLRLRSFSGVFNELRILYGGPNGYESEQAFQEGIWPAWQQAFGINPEEGYQMAVNVFADALTTGLAEELAPQMEELLAENEGRVLGWLSEIGVTTESLLQIDMIRGQALFAVGLSIAQPEIELRSFSDFTWISPFC